MSSSSWSESLLIYRHPKVLVMIALGFSAGLPFLLVFSTLSAWLTEVGVSRTTIAFFSWVGLIYSIKFAWAPVIDRLPLPWLTVTLGKRRSWMLVGQLGIVIGLIGMAVVNPVTQLNLMALMALWVAFSSATQDVSLDAFRIESAVAEYQAAMAATYVLGYRTALLVSGAGALLLADISNWSITYLCMAGLMSIGILAVLLLPEPEHKIPDTSLQHEQRVSDYLNRAVHTPIRRRAITAWFIGAIICPFSDFIRRHGKLALWLLVLIGMYKISDITMGVMANPFYLDMGYSKIEIAAIAKGFGLFMTILGAGLGGLLVVRFGIMGPLLLGAGLIAITNLIFSVLALSEPDLILLSCVISVDNLSGGLTTTVFIAFLSGLTSRKYSATQYALFSSFMTLPGKFIGGFAGTIVDSQGYFIFFVYAAALGIPAMLIIMRLLKLHFSPQTDD